MMAFWKIRDADDYESLSFESSDGKTFSGRLEASVLASPGLTYYLAYQAGGQIHYLPEGAPVSLYTVATAVPPGTAAPAPPPFAPEEKPPAQGAFRLRLDGTLDTAAVKGDSDSSTGTMNSQNARLEYERRTGSVEVTVGARAAYTNAPISGENNADLPDLNLTAKYGGHSLRMGDISISESEFTIAAWGRRGLEYGLKTDVFEFRAFTQSSQVLRGFKGVGLPKNGAALFGGTAAFSPSRGFILKAVIVFGEDDPTLGANIGVSSIYHKRKGRVFSFIGEKVFFDDSLRIQAEYAVSRYDGNLGDGEDPAAGRAFRLEGTFRRSIFDIRAGYRSIGKDFDSVGYLFFLNDRRGVFGTAGLTLGRFRIGGGFRKEETNVEGNPNLATAGLTSGQADITYAFGSSSVRLGFTRESQEASFSPHVWNPYPAFQGTLNKTGFAGGLDLGLKPWLRLSLAGERSRLACDRTPAMNGSLTTASLGLQFFLPEKLMVFPCFSYSRIESSSGPATRALTAVLNGEVTLVRKWLTWNVTAVLSDMTPGTGDPVKSVWADTGINLNLRPIISLADIILSLRGQAIRTRVSGLITNDFRAAVRLTHAFF